MGGIMFDVRRKPLIVVYKDEMLVNQLKKMVETNDDRDDTVVGTKDDSVGIVYWTEDVWLDNKKAGTIKGKILFLDDIKGTEQLIPVLDVKYSEYGIRYGWAGDQAVVFVDERELNKRDNYNQFLVELSKQSIPAFMRKEVEEAKKVEEVNPVDENEDWIVSPFFHAAKAMFKPGVDAINELTERMGINVDSIFKDKTKIRRQMLFFGIIKLYYVDLEKFMNE